MSNKIVLMTHGKVGQALLSAARNTLGHKLPQVDCLAVDTKPSVEEITDKINQIVIKHKNHNILILTDLFGSTPCNIASQLVEKDHVAVVSGINLGMLIRALNYIGQPFDDLIEKTVEGGVNSIKPLRASNDDFEDTNHH